MPDLHDLLERRARTFRPEAAPEAFDRALRRVARRQRNRRLGAAVLALAVFAGAGTGLWLAFLPGTERNAPRPAEFPEPGATTTIAMPSAPTAMAAAPDGSILVTTGTSLYRVDPTTNDLERLFHQANADLSGVAVVSYRTPPFPDDFVFAWLSDRSGTARWVLLHAPAAFLAQDFIIPCCGSVDVGGPALGVAVGAGSVWVTVAHQGPGHLVRIDPRTNEITGRFPTGDGPATVAVGEGGVWVRVTSGNARLQRFDPSTGELVGEQGGDWYVAATTDEAWGRGPDMVQRLMPTTSVTVPIISPEPSGGLPGPSPDPSARVPGAGPLAISGDQVWAVAIRRPERPGMLYEIDRRTGDILGVPTAVGLTPVALVVADGAVWVANFNDPSLMRIELRCGDSSCAGPGPSLSRDR